MIIYINHYYIHCMEFFFVHNLLKLKKKKKKKLQNLTLENIQYCNI